MRYEIWLVSISRGLFRRDLSIFFFQTCEIKLRVFKTVHVCCVSREIVQQKGKTGYQTKEV